ncbi:hypothetical protein OC845_000667 [Tilletia horrida]|nr:hypothetical protein OC845_000667 [Tilletia horrida]
MRFKASSPSLMESWSKHLRHGLEKVPRLSIDGSSAVLLHPSPARWDWRQRATSRLLARARPPTQSSSSNRYTQQQQRGARRQAESSSAPQQRNASSAAGRSLAAHSAEADAAASVWANFGRTIPPQLKHLPRRVMPSQTLLLGSSGAASATASKKKTRTRKSSAASALAASTARRKVEKGKGKAREESDLGALADAVLGNPDLSALLQKHQSERENLMLPEIRAYAARLSKLLDLERDARRKEIEQRQARPIAKLVEQGIALDGLQAYWQGADSAAKPKKKKAGSPPGAGSAHATKKTAIFKLPAGQVMEWNRFRVGDKVELRHGSGALFFDTFGQSAEAGPSSGAGSAFGLTEKQLADVALQARDRAASSAQSASDTKSGQAGPPVGVILEKTPFRMRILFDLVSPALTNPALGAGKESLQQLMSHERFIDLENDLENCTSWRLDLGENDSAETRMRNALLALEHDIDVLERVDFLPPPPIASASTSVGAAAPSSNELEEMWIRSMTTPPPAFSQRSEYVLSGCKVLDTLLDMPPPSLRLIDSPPTGSQEPLQSRKAPSSTFDSDCRIRSWAKRYDRDDPIVMDGDPDLGGLNTSQVRAVAMMLRNRVSLVQGPPGTGKTRTIVETIRLLKQHFEAPQPILLTAHTNVAVDNLAEGCRQAGLRVVRAGSSKAAGGAVAELQTGEVDPTLRQGGHPGRPELVECTLENLMAKHPDKADLDVLTQRLTTARMRLGEMYLALESAGRSVSIVTDAGEFGSEGDDSAILPIMPGEPQSSGPKTSSKSLPRPAELMAMRKLVARLAQRVYFQTQTMLAHILHSADVVCTTALSATSIALRSIDFPVVFFDEGSMATEPVALVALVKGCEHLAIIGDHHQLPPVVTSAEARAGGLSKSLFERLMGDEQPEDAESTKAVPSTMLTVQHRMHPALSAFPNRTFYKNELQNGSRTEQLQPLETGFGTRTGSPYMAFLEHTAPEQKIDNSLQNQKEAGHACDLVASLLLRNPSLRGQDIGMVTPYAAQVLLLGRLIRSDLGDLIRRRMESILEKVDQAQRKELMEQFAKTGTTLADRAKEALEVEVHTVDGFEGREKAAIIFSTVRTNSAGYVGFLADGRRLNVALTRAQRGLFVLGNLRTWERARLGDVGDREMERSDVGLLKDYASHLRQSRAVLPLDTEKFIM